MKRFHIILTIFALATFALIQHFANGLFTNGSVLLATNTFLTTQFIAREALMRLRNKLVMKALVYNDYSNTFQKQGDKIKVKKPPVYTADEFSSTISIQNIIEDSVDVTLDHIADVSINWTSKEKALNIDDFGLQVLDPAMEAIAQKIDEDIYKEFYKAVPYYVGVSGTTPDGLDDFANAAKIMNLNKVPNANRSAVWDPSANAAFSILDAIVHADKSGSTGALREGAIGRIQGMENYWSQNVQTHSAGSFTGMSAPKINTLAVVGSNTLVLKGGSGTETIKAGDVFYVTSSGKNYYYAASADATASSGVVTITTTTKVLAAHAVDDVITFPDKTAGAHVANLAFIKNACAFVSRPLEVPMGGAQGYSTNFEGISLRVTASYDINTKKEILSIDTLYGIKAVYPELATRILG